MYNLERTRCNCHPETCGCSDFVINLNGKFVAAGGDKDSMKQLVKLANESLDRNLSKILRDTD
jgi:hypothetical protein